MALETEESVYNRIISLLFQQTYCKELSLGFAHLAAFGYKMMNMEPVITPFMSEKGLTLSYLIGMMREHVINTAAVNIHIFTQMLNTDT